MGVDTAGCLDLVVVILSHAKVEPMPSSINAWCMLGTHSRYGGWLSRPKWLSVDEARARFAWPRERESLDHIVQLLGRGHAGELEDVLRVR